MIHRKIFIQSVKSFSNFKHNTYPVRKMKILLGKQFTLVIMFLTFLLLKIFDTKSHRQFLLKTIAFLTMDSIIGR